MNKKDTNDLLYLGAFILVVGIFLLVYSLQSYVELKTLSNKIDFEELEDGRLSTSDKYYQHLAYADFLSNKLNKNKKLLVKSNSCIYLDYAQHNAVSLYELVFKPSQIDSTKRDSAIGNIKSLEEILKYYKTCKKYSTYKQELENLIKKSQDLELKQQEKQTNYENFVNGKDSGIEKYQNYSSENDNISDDSLIDDSENIQNNTSNSNQIRQNSTENSYTGIKEPEISKDVYEYSDQ